MRNSRSQFIITTDEPGTNSSLFTVTSAALAISNLIHRFTSSSYSAKSTPSFLNYYIFIARTRSLTARTAV
ncbi:hypothetical protein VTN00DRAFT_2082 [Thermoascus crustaceus]|uniref:uncharacterized protein n=1 Tax=Thermoascus crustaceus TaxID=5088 RepID=UPI0037440718